MRQQTAEIKNTGQLKLYFNWILTILLTWGIPSAIFWTSINIFVKDRVSRQSSLINDQIDETLDNLLYKSLPTRFFQPSFARLFSQLKGLPSNNEVLSRIIKGYTDQWPRGMVEIFLFNGDGHVFPLAGATEMHEAMFNLANSSYGSGPVSVEKLKMAGKLFPAPDLMLNRIRDQRGKLIELGNPDRYSFCYHDFDSGVSSRFVAGIMIFIHMKNLSEEVILNETISRDLMENFGYISEKNSRLPLILASTQAEQILDFYQQFPTSFFKLKDKLVGVKRMNEYTLILGAYPAPPTPKIFLGFLALLFAICSFYFLRLTHGIFVLKKRLRHNLRERLIGLFAICYALPIMAGSFLVFQYLNELKHSMLLEEKHSNYKILAELDSGFTRFVTARLIDFRKFTQHLRENVGNPSALCNSLQEKYFSFAADSLHLVSSTSEVIYSNDLLTAEVRRHFLKPREERQAILESWKARHANISEQHMKALFSTGNPDGTPEEPDKGPGHPAFLKIFASTGVSAMQHYNLSHGISTPIQKSGSNLVIDAMIEANSQTLFQSAKSNIGKFTEIQSLSEIFLAYLDVLPGPTGEAWYVVTMLVDLVNFERQYLEKVFADISKKTRIFNHIFPHEDVRLVSMHPYTVNFPSVNEFSNFEAVIKRSNSDFKTFSRQMRIDGKDCIVSVLRGSYLKHYLLLKVTPLEKIEKLFRQRVNIVVIILAVILVMGLGLARLLTRLLILPINDIMVGIKALSERNYDHTIPIRAENEFGILARAFNESARTLKLAAISQRIKKQLYPENEFRCGSYLISTANTNSRIILSDFYDYTPLKQGTYAIILAEVSGNDISAAYLTAMLKTSFTLLCPSFPFSPEKILEKLNQIFLPYYKKGHLTTCFIGMINPTNDIMICANAGQSYPICISEKHNEKMFINLPSTPIGISAETKFNKHEIKLQDRVIVLYSDGATNLTDPEGNKLGHDKFLDLVKNSLKADARNTSEEIIRHLNEASVKTPWRDDITVMTIQNRI